MPVPPPTLDGVLPPYRGASPGQNPAYMSPYNVTPYEIVAAYATSRERCGILRGWLDHRDALRSIGISYEFQWIDGSFVEQINREPNDIDVVTFLRRPTGLSSLPPELDRALVKQRYHVDFLMVDLDDPAIILIKVSTYYFGLFSHRRTDFLWKGMLQVTGSDQVQDKQAAVLLDLREKQFVGGSP